MITEIDPKEYIRKYQLNPHYSQAMGKHVLSSPCPRLNRRMNPYTEYMNLTAEEELDTVETYTEYRLANENLFNHIYLEE